MDEQSRKRLDEILAKEPVALTEHDKGFMRARRSYLTEEQKAVFAEVLAEGSDEAPKAEKSKKAEKPKSDE
jgi:hypothetical protein